MKKSFFISFLSLFILIIFYVYTLAKAYSDHVFNNISNSFIRFHVIANSNSTDDQIIKYEVRDSIMNFISPKLKNIQSKEDAILVISQNLEPMQNIANEVIKNRNLNYSAKVALQRSKFPTRDYSDFILPEGEYDALTIQLGESHGQNWWCVMFPSICIPQQDEVNLNTNTTNLLSSSLDSESLSIISESSSKLNIQFKFKLIELFENI